MARVYKTKAAAAYIGCSSRFLEEDRRRVARGERGYGPPFRKVGNHTMYDEPDLDAWKNSTRIDPRNPLGIRCK